MTTELWSSKVLFANRDEGMRVIATSDEYSSNMTPFDRQAKIRTLNPATESDYLENCKSYVRSWTCDEIAYLRSMLRYASERMQCLSLLFELPDPVILVKTTGWEEGGANGYTRKNTIFLNQNSLSPELLLHELFHLVSRFNPSKRNMIYESLGFVSCNPIAYDDDFRITNPDAPSFNHFLKVLHGGHEVLAAPIIRSSRPYAGGGFFSYVEKRLLLLEENDGEVRPVKLDGSHVFLRFDQVENLYSQIGRNTAYNIHQEEVSADHFGFLILDRKGLPDQHLVEQMQVILKDDKI